MVYTEFKGNLTAAVRSVVLEAWRERWRDDKWSMAMKKYLPHIRAADPLLLSSILLEHTTLSASPNILLLDYLRYAIHSQMTSFSAMVQNIVQYKDITQPYCLAALVTFLSRVYDFPFSIATPENSLELPRSLALAKAWLLELVLKSLTRLNEPKCPSDITEELLKSCSQLLEQMSKHNVSESLLCLGLSEPDPDPLTNPPTSTSSSLSLASSGQRTFYLKLEYLSAEINRLLCQPFSQPISNELRQSLIACTKFDGNSVLGRVIPPSRLFDGNSQHISLAINILVVMDTYLFPCNDMQVLAEKLVMLEQLQGIERPRLYSEILRSCYLGLMDEDIKPEDIKWSTFIYIRVPSLFSKLLPMSSAEDKQMELCVGIEHLVSFPHLLDSVDSKCSSDCLQFLLKEFEKQFLLTEGLCKRITSKRKATTMRKTNDDQPYLPKEPAYLILKAEPTLITILKSLDSQKNPDMSLRVMKPLMCGKSFELVSSVAAATGKLPSFVVRLIRINEMSKMPVPGEPTKNSQVRATVFDISFLMLCHIVQIYDLEVVSSCIECRSTFFYQWATRCLPEEGRLKPPDKAPQVDSVKGDELLEQLSLGSEFKTSMVRWDEVCMSVPHAMRELLFLWRCKIFSDDTIKGILDCLKGSMCCLAVVASAWLCSAINIGGSNESLQGEFFFLQQLSVYNAVEQCGGNVNNYHERSYLARQFIHFLSSGPELDSCPLELGQHAHNHTTYSLPPEARVTLRDLDEKMLEVFQGTHSSGYFRVGRMLTLRRIHEMTYCLWYAKAIIDAMLTYVVPEDLMKGACMAHAFFQIDLEEMTSCLLGEIIPDMLRMADPNFKFLLEPYSSAIIKLAVMNLAMICRMKQTPKDLECRLSRRKRKRAEYLAENTEENPDKAFKQRRESENQDGASMSINDGFMLGDVLCGQEHLGSLSAPSSSTPACPLKDHLTKPLTSLLLLFQSILSDEVVCQQTDFVLNFIRGLLKAGTTTSRYVLQNSPPNLAQLVAKFMHREVSMDQYFLFNDTTTSSGRNAVVRAIFQAIRQQQ